MCYTTTLDRTLKELERDLNRRARREAMAAFLPPADNGEFAFPETSAFARPFWPVIATDRPDVIDLYRWGFVPKHLRTEEEAKEYLKKYTPFNAISEEVATKPSYKEAWAKGQRCLVPVTSFCEWQHVPVPGRKTPNKVKYRIGTKEEVFFLGGIWQDTALGYRVYTVLTTRANPLMGAIHNTKQRQPVIIPKDMEAFWLSTTLPLDHVMLLCDPIPETDMTAVAA